MSLRIDFSGDAGYCFFRFADTDRYIKVSLLSLLFVMNSSSMLIFLGRLLTNETLWFYFYVLLLFERYSFCCWDKLSPFRLLANKELRFFESFDI